MMISKETISLCSPAIGYMLGRGISAFCMEEKYSTCKSIGAGFCCAMITSVACKFLVCDAFKDSSFDDGSYEISKLEAGATDLLIETLWSTINCTSVELIYQGGRMLIKLKTSASEPNI